MYIKLSHINHFEKGEKKPLSHINHHYL